MAEIIRNTGRHNGHANDYVCILSTCNTSILLKQHKGGRIFFYVSHLHGPIKQGRSVEIK